MVCANALVMVEYILKYQQDVLWRCCGHAQITV